MPRRLTDEEFDALPEDPPSVGNGPRRLTDEEFDALPDKKQLTPQDFSQWKDNAIEDVQRAAMEGGLGGYSSEVKAGLKTAGDVLFGPTKLKDTLTRYREIRDSEDAQNEASKARNPVLYGGTEIGAGIATSLIPGLGIAKAATLPQKFMQAAKVGGLIGGGYSKADLTKGEIGKFGVDVGLGAGAGVVGEGIGQLVGKGIGMASRKGSEILNRMPEERAVKAVTGQNISALRKMTGSTLGSAGDVQKAQGAIDRAGKDLLDEGVIGWASNTKDIAPRLAEARGKYGSQIGEIGKKIDEALPNAVDAKKIADDLVSYAATIPETEGGKALQNKILAEASNFEKKGRMSFYDAQQFKNQFKYKPQDADALINNQDAINNIKGIISREMENTAEVASKASPDNAALLGSYKEAKGKYGTFKGASDAATDRTLKDLVNRFVSPSDYGVGGVTAIGSGGGLPGLAIGAAGAAGNKIVRERGSAFAANAALTLRKVIKTNGARAAGEAVSKIAELARRGNANAILTLKLLRESTPEVNEILGE